MKILQWLKGCVSKSCPALSVALYVSIAVIFGMLIFISDSKEERAAKAAAERTALINAISTASAEKLEAQIKELRANEVHTERIIQTETVKPVFTNVCATDEYVRLLNESIDRAERTLSGQSDGNLSEHTAAPGG